MKKLFQILILFSIGFFINSCYYDAYPEEEVIPPDEDVSYSLDIVPLWGQCVGCHSGGSTPPPDLRDEFSYNALLNGYVIPNDADASVLHKSLLGIDGVSLMPPGQKWSDSKIELVKAWINQGAKDN